MSARTKAHLTNESFFTIVIKLPNKQISSQISEKFFSKLQAFLEKYSEPESITWEELAADRIAKYKKSGLALRGARFRENMSQKTLAKRSGVSQENISKMENGQRAIGIKVAKKLAAILRIDPKLLQK